MLLPVNPPTETVPLATIWSTIKEFNVSIALKEVASLQTKRSSVLPLNVSLAPNVQHTTRVSQSNHVPLVLELPVVRSATETFPVAATSPL